jgi:hypothetical protein
VCQGAPWNPENLENILRSQLSVRPTLTLSGLLPVKRRGGYRKKMLIETHRFNRHFISENSGLNSLEK